MPTLPQSQIPTLASLYATKKLSAFSGQPLYTASAKLNAKVGLIRTDITKLELTNGAIVNAANRRLLGGGGVDGAIHRAAGSSLVNECRRLGGCETGESRITGAYNLPCKKVIHTVGPVYSLESKAQDLLTACYESSLKLAAENGLDAIAFSAVSTGVYGYPSTKAARTALKTVRKFLETEQGDTLGFVVFCNFEKKDEDAYNELIPLYFPPIDEFEAEAEDSEKEVSEANTEQKPEKIEEKADAESEEKADESTKSSDEADAEWVKL